MTNHKWGESPIGRWTLRVQTRNPQTSDSKKSAMDNSGELTHFGLRLFGSNKPGDGKQKRHDATAFVPSARELELIYKRELSIRESPKVIQKRDYQKLINERRQHQPPEEHESSNTRSIFSTIREAFGV